MIHTSYKVISGGAKISLLYEKDCSNGKKTGVSVYVDDLLVIGNDADEIDKFKKSMLQVFEMINLGVMVYFLGMEVDQLDDGIFLSQKLCQ